MKTSIKLLLPIVAATFTSLASANVPATIAVNVPSVTVKYNSAALITQSGVKDLHTRLSFAARSVCRRLDSRLLGMGGEFEQCVRDSVRRSVADVANVNLTNYHRFGTLPSVVAAN